MGTHTTLGMMMALLLAAAPLSATDCTITVAAALRSSDFVGFGWNENGARSPSYPGAVEIVSSKGAMTEADYDAFYDLMAWSGSDFVRVGYFVENENIAEDAVYEPENDNDDPEVLDWSRFRFDNPIHHRYRFVLNKLKARGQQVMLTSWAQPAPWNSPRFPQYEWEEWHPNSIAEYAESVTALVRQLLRHDRMDHIRFLTIWNEPEGDWAYRHPSEKKPYPGQWNPLLAAVAGRLTREGLRTDIRLITADTSLPQGIGPMAEQLANLPVDGAAHHDYRSRSAIMGRQQQMDLGPVMRAAGPDRPVMLTEYSGNGSDAVTGADKLYHGSLSTGHLVIKYLNQGVRGFARWAWSGHGTAAQVCNHTPLVWNTADRWWDVNAPVFWPHAVQARYVKPGWRIHQREQVGGVEENERRVRCAVASSPDNTQLTVLLVNDGSIDQRVEIILEAGLPAVTSLRQISVTGATSGLRVGPEVPVNAGRLALTVPKLSLVTLTTLELGDPARVQELCLRKRTVPVEERYEAELFQPEAIAVRQHGESWLADVRKDSEAGSLNSTFGGAAGVYRVSLRLHDQPGGTARLAVSIGGTVVGSVLTGRDDDASHESVITERCRIEPGQPIRIDLQRGGADGGGVDQLIFTPAK